MDGLIGSPGSVVPSVNRPSVNRPSVVIAHTTHTRTHANHAIPPGTRASESERLGPSSSYLAVVAAAHVADGRAPSDCVVCVWRGCGVRVVSHGCVCGVHVLYRRLWPPSSTRACPEPLQRQKRPIPSTHSPLPCSAASDAAPTSQDPRPSVDAGINTQHPNTQTTTYASIDRSTSHHIPTHTYRRRRRGARRASGPGPGSSSSLWCVGGWGCVMGLRRGRHPTCTWTKDDERAMTRRGQTRPQPAVGCVAAAAAAADLMRPPQQHPHRSTDGVTQSIDRSTDRSGGGGARGDAMVSAAATHPGAAAALACVEEERRESERERRCGEGGVVAIRPCPSPWGLGCVPISTRVGAWNRSMSSNLELGHPC